MSLRRPTTVKSLGEWNPASAKPWRAMHSSPPLRVPAGRSSVGDAPATRTFDSRPNSCGASWPTLPYPQAIIAASCPVISPASSVPCFARASRARGSLNRSDPKPHAVIASSEGAKDDRLLRDLHCKGLQHPPWSRLVVAHRLPVCPDRVGKLGRLQLRCLRLSDQGGRREECGECGDSGGTRGHGVKTCHRPCCRIAASE